MCPAWGLHFVPHSNPKNKMTTTTKDPFLAAAIEEARKGLEEGGLPIGSVIVCDGKIIGRGHNRRVQNGSVIHHAEMNCFENMGRMAPAIYRRCTLYSTLSPCHMCAGTMVHYGIRKCVVGENRTSKGAEYLLEMKDIEVVVANDAECFELLQGFIKRSPEIWHEDIGAKSLREGFTDAPRF
jgi:cytosine/creatinine deaminase